MRAEPTTDILLMTAFPAPDAGAAGGNPAGVVLDATGLDDAGMLAIAAEVGFSETAFITGRDGDGYVVRYFTPEAEIPFCGHATVATAIALAERDGPGTLRMLTPAGAILLETATTSDGMTATFTSVEPAVHDLPDEILDRTLELLGLDRVDLDSRYPVALAFARNTHPVLTVRERATFDAVRFDPRAARELMDEQGWGGTIALLHALAEDEFEARNIFPVGDILEDPATGSAAAAVGAWLRERGPRPVPTTVVIHQGRHVGRPSRLDVTIPATGGIAVTGTATRI